MAGLETRPDDAATGPERAVVPDRDVARLRDLSSVQVKSGVAAWLGWLFDGLDMAEPGFVPVQEWRPRSESEAGARSAMWGGVGRKR